MLGIPVSGGNIQELFATVWLQQELKEPDGVYITNP